MSNIDQLYSDMVDVVMLLEARGEVSLQIVIENNLRKALILGAASYFEHRLTNEVLQFAHEINSGNEMINALISAKAISRQYHTWFDWDRQNMNRFFSLFGEKFKKYMGKQIKDEEDLGEAIRAFLEIGVERNRLVHQNYSQWTVEKTPKEIFELYKKSEKFVEDLGKHLRACSEKIKAQQAEVRTIEGP